MEFLNDKNKFIPLKVELPTSEFKGNSNRAYIISLIKTELDKTVGQKYIDKKGNVKEVQEVSPSYIAVKLSHIKGDSNLMTYHNECLKASVPYSRALWGNIKIRE